MKTLNLFNQHRRSLRRLRTNSRIGSPEHGRLRKNNVSADHLGHPVGGWVDAKRENIRGKRRDGRRKENGPAARPRLFAIDIVRGDRPRAAVVDAGLFNTNDHTMLQCTRVNCATSVFTCTRTVCFCPEQQLLINYITRIINITQLFIFYAGISTPL